MKRTNEHPLVFIWGSASAAMTKFLILGSIFFSGALFLEAGNLQLRNKVGLTSPFVRLSDLVKNEKEESRFKGVFLGKVPEDGTRQIELSYIRRQLLRNGFLTVTPVLSGELNEVEIFKGENAANVEGGVVKKTPFLSKKTKAMGFSPTNLVVVLTKAVKRGDILTKGELVLKDIGKKVLGAHSDVQDLVGKRTLRSLGQGTFLTERLVETPPLVAKGDIVQIKITSGGLKISALGKALSNGSRGDVIEVRRKKKLIQALVTGPKMVEVRT